MPAFKRSFSLDDQVNTDGIQTRYEDGILRVLYPKTETKISAKTNSQYCIIYYKISAVNRRKLTVFIDPVFLYWFILKKANLIALLMCSPYTATIYVNLIVIL